jgi:PAS domain S-box-containing protein
MELLRIAGLAGALLLILEVLKQVLHPDITVWESHIITIVVAAAAAALAGHLVLKRRDVLHRELVESALAMQRGAHEVARSHALLRAALESNRDGVLVAGLDRVPFAWNRRLLEIWDLKEEWIKKPDAGLLGRAAEQLANPGALVQTVAGLRADATTDMSETLELKSGHVIELAVSPLIIEGAVAGRVWRSRDVTTQRRSEQHVRMLAQTVRAVGECVSVTDMNDRLMFVNQAFLDTYGYSETELIDHPVGIVRSDKTPPETGAQILPATLDGGWRGELWNRKKDGTDFQVFLSTSIVRDEAGTPIALVGVARDITEQKQTEDALRRGRDSERIVTLAAGIAHEFNNLLQTVLANTALALEDLEPDNQNRGPLQSVLHASERAANLTTQLLAYAGRGAILNVTSIDLNDEIRDRASFLKALMPPGSSFELALSAQNAAVRADRQHIRQVLTSLLTNAAEAMVDRTGRVGIRTRIETVVEGDAHACVGDEWLAPGRYVGLTISDEGVGMEGETIRRIFDPFFTTKFMGRGMGLPAVLGIARAFGGGVSVDSVPGRGTTVTVFLPYQPTGR